MKKMKQIPIKNINFLRRLDALAEGLYRYPHTAEGLPKPDLTYATLKQYQTDEAFVGYPKEHNYTDYAGPVPIRKTPIPASTDSSFIMMKMWFLRAFLAGIEGAESDKWYYDTLTVQAPDKGFTGWHNSKNKPHHSLRFINNGGRGYSIAVRNGRVTKVPDQFRGKGYGRGHIGAGNWTCVRNMFDGETWFADKNQGAKPRFVVDMAIPIERGAKMDAVEEFITKFA